MFLGPLGEFDRVGYDVDFCTPTGRRPNCIPVSMDSDFFDPPLQRSVTSREMAERSREIDDPSTQQGKRLDNRQALIFKIVRQIAAEGVPILLVEQNAHMALGVAHRAYVLEVGKIVLEGPAKQLAKDDKIRRAYLGVHE